MNTLTPAERAARLMAMLAKMNKKTDKFIADIKKASKMTIHPPFEIGPRLAPALRISDTKTTAWLSYEDGEFVIDLPDGGEYVVKDFHPPRMRVQGSHPLQDDFRSMLGFLGACAESRYYSEMDGEPAMDGENSDLFPENVGAWAQQMSNEISMLECEIEESEIDLLE